MTHRSASTVHPETQARLDKLMALRKNAYYSGILDRLSNAEFTEIVNFTAACGRLTVGAWELAVNRWKLDQKKSKNHGLQTDVLLAIK